MNASLTAPRLTLKFGKGVGGSLKLVFLLIALAIGESAVNGGRADCPPTITAYRLTIAPCETLTEIVIAQVLTGDQPDGSLEVMVTSVPTGLTVSDLYNDEGNILVTVTASCDAEIGTAAIGLAVGSFEDELVSTSMVPALIVSEGTEPDWIPDGPPGIGSILIYHLTTSSIVQPERQDTRITLTNIHPNRSVSVHLFWVDGETGQVADSIICLTGNQTLSMLASDLDPGVTGFLVAIAVDGQTGMPIGFNYLLGDELVKLETGHEADLRAEAVRARESPAPAIPHGPVEAELLFDGVHYQQLPRTLVVSSLPSVEAGNQTMLIVNRLSGDFSTQVDPLGSIYGMAFDDQGSAYGFCARKETGQFIAPLGAGFPRTGLRIDDIIPADRTGWMKIWATDDSPILGAVLNYHPDTVSNAGGFSQGRLLHRLTSTGLTRWVVPLFPPGC